MILCVRQNFNFSFLTVILQNIDWYLQKGKIKCNLLFYLHYAIICKRSTYSVGWVEGEQVAGKNTAYVRRVFSAHWSSSPAWFKCWYLQYVRLLLFCRDVPLPVALLGGIDNIVFCMEKEKATTWAWEVLKLYVLQGFSLLVYHLSIFYYLTNVYNFSLFEKVSLVIFFFLYYAFRKVVRVNLWVSNLNFLI